MSACAVHIPLPRIPAHVRVIRAGRSLTSTPPLYLEAGDVLQTSHGARLSFALSGNAVRITQGAARLTCGRFLTGSERSSRPRVVLALRLQVGRVSVHTGGHPDRGLVVTRELTAAGTQPGASFVVVRGASAQSTRAWTLNRAIVVARTADQHLRIDTRITYTAISDRHGIRLDVWPFSLSGLQRPTGPADHLVPFWADGRPCSVGCTAPGTPGWPLKPFHRQHAIRAGINELRPANFHVGVDIEARNFEPVYAIESGRASIRYRGTGDVNVDVGRFFYWHIHPTVAPGQYVVAYRTMIGRVLFRFGHIAVSEGTTNDYLNPLRPGGSLRPYHDSEPPTIGVPRVFADGRVIVGAFDPQSFVRRGSYETPVLAPSSLAWRLYDAHGHALTGLEWAMRGSHNYPPGLKRVIFAPGASNPGFACFAHRVRCIPNWVYWLAGGLTRPLPLSSLAPGRYRLTVYAWDWAGNTSALDLWLKLPLSHAAADPSAEFGPLAARFDYP